jgi:hypothetical protein
MYTSLDAEKDFKLILQSIKENGEIKVHRSLSDVESIYKEVEEREDIPRTAFNIMVIALFVRDKKNTDSDIREKINKVIDFVSLNKEKGGEIDSFFTNLYLLRTLIYLKKDRQEIMNQLNYFLKIVLSIKNKYNQPLLANKLISFYEEYKNDYDLSSLERPIANLKSVMLYLVSSDLSKNYPFFHFADMLVWSKKESFHDKVIVFLESRLASLDVYTVSSSALAYMLECMLRSGHSFDKKIYEKIKRSELSLEKYNEVIKEITPGLYLNTPNESVICLDTNAHLLFGFLNSNYDTKS